jgi:hypothetical protein
VPDIIYAWSLWWLNFLHMHPLVFWSMIIIGISANLVYAKRG